MDHSRADYIEYKDGVASYIGSLEPASKKIKSEDGIKNNSTRFSSNTSHYSNNENKKNYIAQNELSDFYKQLEKKLEAYGEILLFGPTNAKDQLNNLLSLNKQYSDKKISVEKSDKLSKNQMLAFVRNYYDNKLKIV